MGDVEGKAAGTIAAAAGFGGGRKQLADVIEQAGIGGEVRSRGPPDRLLVDLDDAADFPHAAGDAAARGFLCGLQQGIGIALLGQSYSSADLATANATFASLYAAGMLIGPPALGAGLEHAPPHGPMWMLAALFAGYLLLTVRRRRSPDRA